VEWSGLEGRIGEARSGLGRSGLARQDRLGPNGRVVGWDGKAGMARL